jgi:hypothetical protein
MYQECRHIMPSGAKCHSPAMRGMAHTPARRAAYGQSRARKKPLKLPAMVDRNAVLVAINQVFDAISSSTITPRSAGQLLFGLQIVSNNLRRPGRPPQPKREEVHQRKSRKLNAENEELRTANLELRTAN